jgi:hypothetical protein
MQIIDIHIHIQPLHMFKPAAPVGSRNESCGLLCDLCVLCALCDNVLLLSSPRANVDTIPFEPLLEGEALETGTIAIIGAGTMGRGIAYAAAPGGFRTVSQASLETLIRCTNDPH